MSKHKGKDVRVFVNGKEIKTVTTDDLEVAEKRRVKVVTKRPLYAALVKANGKLIEKENDNE